MKSKWCLLIDVPLVLVFMIPSMLVGAVFSLVEIGFCFARHLVEQWFKKGY